MAYSSQFEPAIQTVETTAIERTATTATPLQSGQSLAQSTPVSSAPRLQPHTKPQSVISSWTWAVFMTSTALFLGSIFFASLTKTAAIPQLTIPFSSAISGWNTAPK